MSTLFQRPVLHGRDHCPDGPDPIPCMPDLSFSASYPDLIQAHPCLVHYWPCDETAGDLVDRKGDWDMAATTDGGYPTYGAAGPLTELPEYTAVVNAGTAGVFGSPSRFVHAFSSVPFWASTHPFAVEFWVYLTSYNAGGVTVFVEAADSGGTTPATVGTFGGSDKLSVTRGGVAVTDTVSLPLNAWQHVVANYDGATLGLWRNGNLVASAGATGSVTITAGNVSWMNRNTSAWTPANGRGAQLALYDCALTETEIAEHLVAQDTPGDAPAGSVLTSDGEGGYTWEPLVTEDALADTEAWMPLADSDGTLVLDGDGNLIPTLIPI